MMGRRPSASGSDLNAPVPTTCGRWTSKATSPPEQTGVIPSPCWMTTPRFSLGLYACANERTDTVREHLTSTFRVIQAPGTDHPYGFCASASG